MKSNRKPVPRPYAQTLLAVAAQCPNAQGARIVIENGQVFFEDAEATPGTIIVEPLEPVVTREKAAELFGCTKWAIDKMRQRGLLKPVYTHHGKSHARGFTWRSVNALLTGTEV